MTGSSLYIVELPAGPFPLRCKTRISDIALDCILKHLPSHPSGSLGGASVGPSWFIDCDCELSMSVDVVVKM